MMTQEQTVLRYLERHKKGLTTIEGFEKFGITRLSERIRRLRSAGHDIITVNEVGLNRYGQKVRYGRYVLRA